MYPSSAKAARIHDLDVRISELEEQLCALRRERNQHTSFGGLLPEILGMIYEHIQEDYDVELPERVSFTHLCSHIYHSITSTPHLWTAVDSSDSRCWRDLCVARSKGLPLQVTWCEDIDDEAAVTEEDRWMHEVFATATSATMDFTGGLFGYVTQMSIEATGGTWNPTRSVGFLYSPAPLMRRLKLYSGRYYLAMDIPLLLNQLQHLNELKLDTITLSSGDNQDTFQKCYCPSMGKLAIRNCDLSLQDVYYMIRAMPNLEILKVIQHSGGNSYWDPSIDTDIITSLSLPRLHTLKLLINKAHVYCMLCFIPAPSKHLDVYITQTGYPQPPSFIESIMDEVILTRLQSFWTTITDSLIPTSLRVTFSISDIESDNNCALTVTTAHDGSSLQYSTFPALFYGTLSRIDIHSPLTTKINILKIQPRGSLKLRGHNSFHINLLTGVRHIIIRKGYKNPEVLEEWPNEEQDELEQWVRKVAEAGRPLETITFDDPQQYWPVPAVLTERLMAAGGPTLRIVGNGIDIR
jgi:hypothetical protein